MTIPLKIIPLGGLGEVGKNMTIIEYDGSAIMVDCGIMFPGADMPGVNLVIPDTTFLQENPNLLKAIFITHGHEDHIGAIPFVIKSLGTPPIYATKLTEAFIYNKLKRAAGITPKDIEVFTVVDGDTITVGPFTLEPFRVSHSIPDAVGYIIHTPVGTIVHTGEYKFDSQPYSGITFDEARLKALGDSGVLALLSDSTNAERLGFTGSEQTVTENIREIFSEAKGRIITATFASNIYRIQLLADLAMEHNRKVVFVGRSIVDNTRMARDLGYLTIPDDIIVPADRLHHLPDDQVCIICTGTQGEGNSALVRMANGEHGQVDIIASDTIIISATTIPGNEELANNTLDNLFRLGANVIYQSLKTVHVSGHASREGQKQMLSLIRPKFFIPIQGEYRMLVLQGQLTTEIDTPPEEIMVVENGQTIEITPDAITKGDIVHAGNVYVDGLVGDVGPVVLRDRTNLSRDGFVTCVVAIDEQSGDLLDGPNLVSRGFVYMKDNEILLDDAADVVVTALGKLGKNTHTETINDIIHSTLTSFFYRQTHRRPMVFPVVLEV